MEKIKHKCPICGKTEFSSESSFEICDYCGWEDDGLQEYEPNYWGGANELSKEDYIKLYNETIKINSKYKWSKDNKIENFERYDDVEHTCPVCNKTIFKHHNSHDRCKFCGWIDNWVQENYPNYGNSSNHLDLNSYINKYNKIIKNNPQYVWIIENGEFDLTKEEKDFIDELNLSYKVNKSMTHEELNNLFILLDDIKRNNNLTLIDNIEEKINLE